MAPRKSPPPKQQASGQLLQQNQAQDELIRLAGARHAFPHKSCEPCRFHKTKCVIVPGTDVCQACQTNGSNCVFAWPKKYGRPVVRKASQLKIQKRQEIINQAIRRICEEEGGERFVPPFTTEGCKENEPTQAGNTSDYTGGEGSRGDQETASKQRRSCCRTKGNRTTSNNIDNDVDHMPYGLSPNLSPGSAQHSLNGGSLWAPPQGNDLLSSVGHESELRIQPHRHTLPAQGLVVDEVDVSLAVPPSTFSASQSTSNINLQVPDSGSALLSLSASPPMNHHSDNELLGLFSRTQQRPSPFTPLTPFDNSFNELGESDISAWSSLMTVPDCPYGEPPDSETTSSTPRDVARRSTASVAPGEPFQCWDGSLDPFSTNPTTSLPTKSPQSVPNIHFPVASQRDPPQDYSPSFASTPWVANQFASSAPSEEAVQRQLIDEPKNTYDGLNELLSLTREVKCKTAAMSRSFMVKETDADDDPNLIKPNKVLSLLHEATDFLRRSCLYIISLQFTEKSSSSIAEGCPANFKARQEDESKACYSLLDKISHIGQVLDDIILSSASILDDVYRAFRCLLEALEHEDVARSLSSSEHYGDCGSKSTGSLQTVLGAKHVMGINWKYTSLTMWSISVDLDGGQEGLLAHKASEQPSAEGFPVEKFAMQRVRTDILRTMVAAELGLMLACFNKVLENWDASNSTFLQSQSNSLGCPLPDSGESSGSAANPQPAGLTRKRFQGCGACSDRMLHLWGPALQNLEHNPQDDQVEEGWQLMANLRNEKLQMLHLILISKKKMFLNLGRYI